MTELRNTKTINNPGTRPIYGPVRDRYSFVFQPGNNLVPIWYINAMMKHNPSKAHFDNGDLVEV